MKIQWARAGSVTRVGLLNLNFWRRVRTRTRSLKLVLRSHQTDLTLSRAIQSRNISKEFDAFTV